MTVIANIKSPDGTNTIGGEQFDGQWVFSSLRVVNNVTIAAEGSTTVDLSTYLPDTTYRYEVILEVRGSTGTSSGNTIRLLIGSGSNANAYYREFGCRTRSASNEITAGMCNIIINAGDAEFTIQNTDTNSSATGVYVYALYYRRLGWNEHSTAPQNQIENVKIPTSTLQPNGIIWGSLTNTSGVLSNFGISNYFEVLDGRQDNNAEYVFKFTITGQSTVWQAIVHAEYCLTLQVLANSYDIFTYNWQTATSVTLFTATPNTPYWVKVSINGTSKTYSYSTDGENYTTLTSFTDTEIDTSIANYPLILGNGSLINQRLSGNFLVGTIDLSECYINVDGTHFWNGLDYVQTQTFGGDNFDGQWQTYNGSSISICNDVTLNASASTSADISTYIPNDGYAYELLIRAYGRTNTTSGNTTQIRVGTSSTGSNNHLIFRQVTRSNSYRNASGNCVLPITSSQRRIYVYNGGSAATINLYVQIVGYKRIGKNITGGTYLENINAADGTTTPFGGKITDGQWVTKRSTVVNAVQFNDSATTNHDYTVSKYLPTNNEWYEILISTYGATGTTSGNNLNWTISCQPNPIANNTNMQQGAYINTRTASSQVIRLNGMLIGRQDAKGNMTVRIRNFTTVQTSGNTVYFSGYRRLGTNQ